MYKRQYYNIDVLNLGRELELEKKWFLCRTPQRLLHIFDELYAAKGSEGRDYFRIKLLELFYHIKQLRIEDQMCIRDRSYIPAITFC